MRRQWRAGHWDATVAPYQKGCSSTVAPLVVQEVVIIGSAGGEFGVRLPGGLGEEDLELLLS